MATWTAGAKYIVHDAIVRARDEDDADRAVYELAEDYLFDSYIPLDADYTRVFMRNARRVPGSEDAHGIPLMKGDVVVSLDRMIAVADSEKEAESEFRRCLDDWAPMEFPFDGGWVEFELIGPEFYDEEDYYENWSPRSKASKSVRRRFFPEGMTSEDMAEAIAEELIACGLDKDGYPGFDPDPNWDVYNDCYYYYFDSGVEEDFAEWADAVRPRSPKGAAMIEEAIRIFIEKGTFEARDELYDRLNAMSRSGKATGGRSPAKRRGPVKRPVSGSGKAKTSARKPAAKKPKAGTPKTVSKSCAAKTKAPAKKKPAVSKSTSSKPKAKAPAKKAPVRKPAVRRR